FGVPQWVFGSSTYAFVGGDIVCVYIRNATGHLARIRNGSLEDIETPYTSMTSVTAFGDRVAVIAASPTEFSSVVTVDPSTGAYDVVKRSRDEVVDPGYVSAPEAIDFESEGRPSHAFFYAPKNKDFEAPSDER